MTTNKNGITEQNYFDLTDAELNLMLAQWANEELDVPEGFHDSVMNRLRTEAQPTQAPQKKGIVVSLAERFANKKAWVSTIAAAALVLCCLPVLQDRQDTLAGVENSASQVYEMKSRVIDDTDGTSDEPAMINSMMADAQASPIAANTVNEAIDVNGVVGSTEKFASQQQDSYSYTIDESRADLTPEEQLKLAQDNLVEMESHLAILDDNAENQLQREELQKKINELKAEIEALEEQINTAE